MEDEQEIKKIMEICEKYLSKKSLNEKERKRANDTLVFCNARLLHINNKNEEALEEFQNFFTNEENLVLNRLAFFYSGQIYLDKKDSKATDYFNKCHKFSPAQIILAQLYYYGI